MKEIYRVRRAARIAFAGVFMLCAATGMSHAQQIWYGLGANKQHTGISLVASQSLNRIVWQTPVDLMPQYSGDALLIHYGSPLLTGHNTTIVPVKTGATDGFRIEARNGLTGHLKWMVNSDYVLPPHGWTPSYGPAMTPKGRIYFPGKGGTVYWVNRPDATQTPIPTKVVFFGSANYNANPAAYDQNVIINTPLTSDAAGNIYFGFLVRGATPLNLQSGIARITSTGVGKYAYSSALTGGGAAKVATNCAPALSPDGLTLYVGMNNGGWSNGILVALNSSTLAFKSKVALKDVASGSDAAVLDDSTASPTVGPDGDVYYGVIENPFRSSKGWLLHFSADLATTKTAGAFGWDDTVAVVPVAMVPSYQGTSSYLLFSKYNNYAGLGGDGVNKIAILDPFDSQTDARTGATVMKEVLTIAGVTPDDDFPNSPNAVREWCINAAVVDPFTKSVLANSEDGNLYRWDLTTNTFTQVITLTSGIGEAYTPTMVGSDGKVYAINNAILFAIGN